MEPTTETAPSFAVAPAILVVLLLAAAALLVFLTRAGKLRPLWRNRFGLLRAPWRLFLFGALLGASFLASVLILTPLRNALPQGEMDFGADSASLPAIIVGYAMLVAVAVFASAVAARAFDRRSFASVGLGFHSRWRRELIAGCALGAIFITAVVAAQAAFGAIRISPAGVETSVLVRGGALYFLLFIGVAFLEELLFRGFALQVLAESIGRIPAAILVSAPFGVIHYFNHGGTKIGALSTGVAGLLLCFAYFRTRSLWLPVGMHITWNFTMGWLWSQPVSGEVLPSVPFETVVRGPEWMSGGSFGPEGSFLSFLGMVGMALWIARSRFFDPSPEANAWYPPPEERAPAAHADAPEEDVVRREGEES